MFRQLTDRIFVAPQIDVGDVMDAAQAGVTLIINNRP
ncbi:MAG: sulfur transferase domain-containing protein, partial [Pseudomonadota bacterium]